MSYLELTLNFKAAKVRFDELEGRRYAVVPMVMLTEGVHNGSRGALYYPPEEIARTVEAWNHKPIVVYHPTINGRSVSACDPVILNSRKIGVVLNTRWEDGKLRAEAWIDVDKAAVVDSRVIDAIDSGTVLELSTGLFVDPIQNEGLWNDESYDYVASNFRPDHLAILPDLAGACSIEDGAGFLRNSALQQVRRDFSHLVASSVDIALKRADVGADPVRNQLFELIALKRKDTWIDEVVNNVAIVQTADEYFAQRFSIDGDGKVTLNGDLEPVIRSVTFVGHNGPIHSQESKMSEPVTLNQYVASAPDEIRAILEDGLKAHNAEKAKLVNVIVANKRNTFAKEALEAKPLVELRAIAAFAELSESEKPAPDYSGAATPVGNAAVPAPVEEEPLELPKMVFGS